MSVTMDDSIKRWTAKRKTARVIEIIQGKTTVAEARGPVWMPIDKKASGAQRGRPELARMLDHLQPGNVVTVTRLDRLARSTRDLLDIAERIGQAEAGLRSLAEPWADTTTPAGRMVLTFFAGVAEFERSLIHERTSAGRAAAKAKGVRFGRPPALSAEQIAHARELISEDKKPTEVARLLCVHRAALYRALERAGVSY